MVHEVGAPHECAWLAFWLGSVLIATVLSQVACDSDNEQEQSCISTCVSRCNSSLMPHGTRNPFIAVASSRIRSHMIVALLRRLVEAVAVSRAACGARNGVCLTNETNDSDVSA
jgi:hypothetical protein